MTEPTRRSAVLIDADNAQAALASVVSDVPDRPWGSGAALARCAKAR
jgi:hypothetical protein